VKRLLKLGSYLLVAVLSVIVTKVAEPRHQSATEAIARGCRNLVWQEDGEHLPRMLVDCKDAQIGMVLNSLLLMESRAYDQACSGDDGDDDLSDDPVAGVHVRWRRQ